MPDLPLKKCACESCDAIVGAFPPRHCRWCYDNCTALFDGEAPDGASIPDPRRKVVHVLGLKECERLGVSPWTTPEKIALILKEHESKKNR